MPQPSIQFSPITRHNVTQTLVDFVMAHDGALEQDAKHQLITALNAAKTQPAVTLKRLPDRRQPAPPVPTDLTGDILPKRRSTDQPAAHQDTSAGQPDTGQSDAGQPDTVPLIPVSLGHEPAHTPEGGIVHIPERRLIDEGPPEGEERRHDHVFMPAGESPEVHSVVVYEYTGDVLPEPVRMPAPSAPEPWTGWLVERDGDIVGYAHAMMPVGKAITLDIAAAPEVKREVKQHVLEDLQGQFPGRLVQTWHHHLAPETNLDQLIAERATKAGPWRVQRVLAHMVMEVPERLMAPTNDLGIPDDIEIITYDGTIEQRLSLLATNNAAFAHHPEQGGWSLEKLEDTLATSIPVWPNLLLAWDTTRERVVGMHWTEAHELDGRPAGEVKVIGIHPDMQGMGLGRALMDAGIYHMATAFGAQLIDLYVDRSEVAPLTMYRAYGFAERSISACLEFRLAES